MAFHFFPGGRNDNRITVLLRRILLVSLLVLAVLWGVSKNKFVVNLVPVSYAPSAVKPIEVHPEVLNLQESFARVSDAVKPAVVNITAVHLEQVQSNPFEFFFWNQDDLFEHFFNEHGEPRPRRAPKRPYQRKVPGTGSGVIIDPDGYILTNEHVVQGAEEIKVTLADDPDKKLDGRIIGRDQRTDLAVIKIKTYKKLPFAVLGDSDRLRVGDWAIAIGSPFGLEQTVTVGVISASRQNLAIESRHYKDLIQTDAAINPGNSGGPLVNIHGEVVGINTAIYTPSGGFAGIGFAIPINRAKEIIPQLREKGKVVRGWIGIILENKIDEATAAVFGVPDAEGAMVRNALPGYPAARAGLRRGDVIRQFDGQKIRSNSDLQGVVASVAPGKKVPVKIIRGRKEMDLEILVSEAPNNIENLAEDPEVPADADSRDDEARTVWLGATVKDLTPAAREGLELSDKEKGVFVYDVEDGSRAEEIGLLHGDMIRSVNQEPVPDLKAFGEVIRKIKTKDGVVLDILRRGESLYLSYMGPEK